MYKYSTVEILNEKLSLTCLKYPLQILLLLGIIFQ